MPLKKYINGSWVDTSYKRYETGTDAVTNLPVEIFTDGQPVSSYTLKGNTSVSGTASPQNPVTISGVGNETANLINIDNSNAVQYSSGYDNYTIDSNKNINGTGRVLVGFKVKVEPSTTYTFCTTCNVHKNIKLRFREYSQEPIDYSTGYIQMPYEGDFRSEYTLINHVTVSAETTWILLVFYAQADYAPFVLSDIMVAEGQYSTLDFEPYGKYKISILKDSQALTPIYLSQPLFNFVSENIADAVDSSGTFTKNIQYIVLTGNETFTVRSSPEHSFSFGFSSNNCGRGVARIGICSHFPTVTSADKLIDGTSYFGTTGFSFRIDTLDTLTDCTNYLKAQYAAGTPVTFIYFLSTAETESVTVPTITTTGGTVTLDVDTTIKPSEMSLTYHGWHEHEPLKRENGSWS